MSLLFRVLLSLQILLLASCSAYKLDSAQASLRTSFASRNYSGSVTLLNEMESRRVYRNKDAVLLNLEQGTANHFAGNYRQSNRHFTKAEDQIDFLFSKSISRAVKSFINNDNTLDYDGEDYEDIYLNIFKALNYIHMDDLEAALVEARRIAFKLTQLSIKYGGLVEALSKADTTGHATWETGKTNVQNSAYGHYLATILYAKTNRPDDARIEYEKLRKAFEDQSSVYTFPLPEHSRLQTIKQPEKYNVLVNCFSGRSLRKVQHDMRLYLYEADLYLKLSLPALRMYKTQVHRVEAVVNDTLRKEVDLIEEMDVVARDVYQVKQPVIYSRTIVRAFLKAVGTNTLSRQLAKRDETLGEISNLLGKIGQEATEKADLRGWQTLPGKAYVAVLDLPPGEHNVTINYLSSGNRILFSETRTLEVTGPHALELVESLYWN